MAVMQPLPLAKGRRMGKKNLRDSQEHVDTSSKKDLPVRLDPFSSSFTLTILFFSKGHLSSRPLVKNKIVRDACLYQSAY